MLTRVTGRVDYLQIPRPRVYLFKTNIAFSSVLCWNSLPVQLYRVMGKVKARSPRVEAADGYRTSSYCYKKMFIVKSVVT